MGGLPSPTIDLLAAQAAEMGDSELDAMRDADLCDVLRVISGFYLEHVWREPGDPRERFPHAVATLEHVIEMRAKALAVELYVGEGLEAAESISRSSRDDDSRAEDALERADEGHETTLEGGSWRRTRRARSRRRRPDRSA